MAQLSSDSFAFGHDLLRVEAAQRLIGERVHALPGVEEIDLAAADGRVLAASLDAPIDLPPFANSAVDGYAVRFADLAVSGPSELPVAGRAAAGRPFEGEARLGAAARIFTGAAMPAGFDTVFMQEDVETTAAGVRLPQGLKRFANMRPAGEDIAAGARAFEAGRRLTPADVALAAALGLTRLTVRARPRVGVFSTGDELAEPGAPLGPGAIYDANRFALAALVARAGAIPVDLGRLPDDRAAIRAGLGQAAARCDLLVTSGGVSTGEEDHVRAALEQDGALAFWRVAIKPGRPVAMGVIGGVPLIGLPGNPAAAFITFAQIARAVIAALAGEAWRAPQGLPVVAGFAYVKKEGRREYVRASLDVADGALRARKYEREGAGVVTSLTRTDGLVELAEDKTRVAPGDAVGFIPWALLA